jgi:hypothetical protein
MEWSFRGQHLPVEVQGNKSLRVQWALRMARASDKPEIKTNEFVYDLQVHRFGGYIFNLRQSGWDIKTREIDNATPNRHFTFELISTREELEDSFDEGLHKSHKQSGLW